MGKVFLSEIKELLRLRLIIEKEMGIQKKSKTLGIWKKHGLSSHKSI